MESGDNKYNRNALNKGKLAGNTQGNEVLLKASGITKTFLTSEGEIKILRGIDLEIRMGEMTSIVGASGAGKSTLLYLLSGLDNPTDGTVFYGSENLSSMTEKKLARFRNINIGFIFQFHYLLSEFSALENVMMPLLISGKSKKLASELAYNILEKVDLKDRMSHRPGKLSGGEQQRVAVARALVTNPKIVFADEPSGNLDEKTADNLHELMAEINKSTGVTFLIATHNQRLADMAQKTYELSSGQLHLQ
ncbi:MAG: ABC transporter ATP-binding protein [candidate division Zixibacteria bacterium]|nr:ABC transporter ATP-binding protein [candidate division Zixibacteria bacterium]NIR62919.1 ABC transporter ATP-binding protein [candidate division Zixibacteria bacterium]NIS16056.1 ABC transporter ATP-binding protein [candidate division Zixibacteria bacterium]NIS44929.1 ABC transporter ATP-binding protein [candidate division Zixibacteria bacterium]NIT52467.1 ABC transporter ATP-binding protein [candidate division Zixibacteria bacterium]